MWLAVPPRHARIRSLFHSAQGPHAMNPSLLYPYTKRLQSHLESGAWQFHATLEGSARSKTRLRTPTKHNCPAETHSRHASVSSMAGIETAEASVMVTATKWRSFLSRFARQLRSAHVLPSLASTLPHFLSSGLASQHHSHRQRMTSS